MEKIKDMVFFANENTEGVKLSSTSWIGVILYLR